MPMCDRASTPKDAGHGKLHALSGLPRLMFQSWMPNHACAQLARRALCACGQPINFTDLFIGKTDVSKVNIVLTRNGLYMCAGGANAILCILNVLAFVRVHGMVALWQLAPCPLCRGMERAPPSAGVQPAPRLYSGFYSHLIAHVTVCWYCCVINAVHKYFAR